MFVCLLLYLWSFTEFSLRAPLGDFDQSHIQPVLCTANRVSLTDFQSDFEMNSLFSLEIRIIKRIKDKVLHSVTFFDFAV